MKQNPKIHSTKNYSRFVFPPDYPLPPRHRVVALVRAMKRDAKVRPIPARTIARGRLMINHDGGKRFLARKALGLPILYVLEEAQTFIDAAREGDLIDRTTLSRLLDHRVLQRLPAYVKLREFVDRFSLPISVSIQLFDSTRAKFKSGAFEAKNEDLALYVGEILQRLRNLISIRVDHHPLIKAIEGIVRWAPAFDPDRFLKKLATRSDWLIKCDSRDGYVKQIEDIYNARPLPARDFYSLTDKVQFGERFGNRKAA